MSPGVHDGDAARVALEPRVHVLADGAEALEGRRQVARPAQLPHRAVVLAQGAPRCRQVKHLTEQKQQNEKNKTPVEME